MRVCVPRLTLVPLLLALSISAAAKKIGEHSSADCTSCPEVVLITPVDRNVKPFYLGKYEVTWREYRPSVIEFSCPIPKNTLNKDIVGAEMIDDDIPVTGVTPDDFDCYLRYLNKKSGRSYRLPSPEEWLSAASEVEAKAVQRSAQSEGTTDPRESVLRGWVGPVGQGSPSRSGVYDLEGNAGEATNAARHGMSIICQKFGQRYCREVKVFGLNRYFPDKSFKDHFYFVQGVPDIHFGYRVVRD